MATVSFTLDAQSVDHVKKTLEIQFNPGVKYVIDENFVFSAPCAPYGGVHPNNRNGQMGMFSYSWSQIGVFLGSIGNYCSIAGHTIFGDSEHRLDVLTTSNVLWDTAAFGGFTQRKFGSVKYPKVTGSPKTFLPIEIEHDVWIGIRCYIKQGVKIGTGSVIGAHTVVTKDIPPYSVVVGNPGVIKRKRFSDKIIERLLEVKWWNYVVSEIPGLDISDLNKTCDLIQDLETKGKITSYKPQVITAREIHDFINK